MQGLMMEQPLLISELIRHADRHHGSAVKKCWVTDLFPGSPCVTAYASANPWEDFAETYAYYVLHPHLLEMQFPEKHAFMRDCVFSGSPVTLKERERDGPGRRS